MTNSLALQRALELSRMDNRAPATVGNLLGDDTGGSRVDFNAAAPTPVLFFPKFPT